MQLVIMRGNAIISLLNSLIVDRDLEPYNRPTLQRTSRRSCIRMTTQWVRRFLLGIRDDVTNDRPVGKELRLKQQYFWTAASLSDILRRFKNIGKPITEFADCE